VGLGVSISESIIAEYGGRLEYSSEPGKGTTATVSLRASVGEGGPEARRPGASGGGDCP